MRRFNNSTYGKSSPEKVKTTYTEMLLHEGAELSLPISEEQMDQNVGEGERISLIIERINRKRIKIAIQSKAGILVLRGELHEDGSLPAE